MNWNDIQNFSPDEFADDPKYAEPDLIYTLDKFRNVLGERIFPSPVPGSLVRFDGNPKTQHYAGPKGSPVRKSTAVDVFPEGVPILVYSILLTIPKINGIGVYLDTTGNDGYPWIMFHIDIRPKGFDLQPLIWICEKVWDVRTHKRINTYRYPQRDPQYWRLFSDERMYRKKIFGNGFNAK